MIHYLKALLAVALITTLSACGGTATSATSIVGNWAGTQTDGQTISLQIVAGAPNVSANLSINGGANRALTGTYEGSALEISANDETGVINFNATVTGNSMTGSYVTFRVADPIGSGGSFTMTKQ